MSEVEITDANWDVEVLQSELPVLVDFWAPWCGPCRAIAPVVAELAEEYKGKLKVGKVNVDENNGIAGRYGVMSIPTLKVFKGGQIVADVVGAAPKPALVEAIAKAL